ncbi:unnamed protein product [Caenorhabditis angaria]|uniref:Glycosyltransferase family 92 protein n=1 Tax=Caenorhabditis angaria TaxID=860376 RepID=A0A9P1IQ31_9PELO|nr:unnamed protein product [Caenorhabditis angaria]
MSSNLLWDSPRSHRSAKGNNFKLAPPYAAFLEYAEELAENLEQPAVCRAYASYFDRQDNYQKWPPEREEKLELRSSKRHLHVYSHLQNREIGQNIHGRRSLSSTILNSECREYRYDQTLGTDGFGESVVWKNRKIYFNQTGTLVPYDSMSKPCQFQHFAPGQSKAVLFVEPNHREFEAIPDCEKYVVSLKDDCIEAHSLDKLGKLRKRYRFPKIDGLKISEIGWRIKNESIYVKGQCVNRKNWQPQYHVFFIFDAFPFKFRTSFRIDSNATPEKYGHFYSIVIVNDVIEVKRYRKTLFYSFADLVKKYEDNLKASYFHRDIPILFRVSELGEPLGYSYASVKHECDLDENNLECTCNDYESIPSDHTIKINNLKNLDISLEKAPAIFQFGDSGTFFGDEPMFLDPFTSTFLVIEQTDFVKYQVKNGLKTVEKVWRTKLFRNMMDICGRYPLLDKSMKIYDTQFDGENLIIKLSLDYSRLKPDGSSDCSDYRVKIYLLYIMDYTTGEILRIVPIHRRPKQDIDDNDEDAKKHNLYTASYRNDQFLFEEDLLIFQKYRAFYNTRMDSRLLEVWELIEPQQYIQDGKREKKPLFWNRNMVKCTMSRNCVEFDDNTDVFDRGLDTEIDVIFRRMDNLVLGLERYTANLLDLPDERVYEKWRAQRINYGIVTISEGEMRLVSAFVYEDHVAVVISMFGRENMTRPVKCHYFDCNRKHIGTYDSRIFPVSSVRCGRKFGAEFISITVAHEESSIRDPIPLIDRTSLEPPHLLGVCAGQVYGKETRFVDIVETVEHHRMIGASMFYLTVFESDDATNRVILDYEKLGLMEPTWVSLEFQQVTYQFHYIQVADCYYRSRMHSKWVINLDIDERFLMKSPTNLPRFLETLQKSPEVTSLSFQVSRIQVEDSGIFTAAEKDSRFFEKYRVMSRAIWENFKTINQPQYSHIPFYHWAWRISPGKVAMQFNSTIGYFRHYRLTSSKHIGSNWLTMYAPFAKNSLDPGFAKNLKSRISRKLSYLFDKTYIKCNAIMESAYKKSDFIGQVVYTTIHQEYFKELMNRNNLEDLTRIHVIGHTIDTCKINGKNNLTTRNLSDERLYEKWRAQNVIDRILTLNEGEMRLVSAFVYGDHVAVVISMFGVRNISRPVKCHYFDCNRKHIGTFDSRIFPISSIRCVRKFGAEFISITVAHEESSIRDPIPLIDRTSLEPPHLLGVCAGQVYGKETRFVDIIETVEHHRMIGASMFYLTVFESDDATNRVILDYERLGLMEPTWVSLEFQQVTYQFHYIQVADCYYRSRMHSKWVVNLDIDERFLMKSPTVLPRFLHNLSPKIVGLSFQVARIKVEDSGILRRSEMFFEKYRKMSRPIWENFKGIHQHQYTHIPFYHFPWRNTPRKMIMHLNSTIGYFRHYRLTSSKHIGSNWLTMYAPFAKNSLDPGFAKNLKSRISRKLSYLFDKTYIKCNAIMESAYKKSDFIGQGYKCI